VYIQTYDYGKAVEHLQSALALEPRYGSARKELRRLLCRMN
jgi:hypothetical protein